MELQNEKQQRYHHLPYKSRHRKEVIGIIGTGNYGIAIGKRLIHYGFRVAYGSREPNYAYVRECMKQQKHHEEEKEEEEEELFSVTSVGDAWLRAENIIFLAVSPRIEVYEQIVSEFIQSMNSSANRRPKILVDVSNSAEKEKNKNKKKKNRAMSNAEKLSAILDARKEETRGLMQVVKGFNLLNAYSMSNYAVSKGNVELVPIVGDEASARNRIIKLSNEIGFQGVDTGSLSNAYALERFNKATFSEWQWPTLVCLCSLLVNVVWTFFWNYVYAKKATKWIKYAEDFSLLNHLNKGRI